MARVEMTSNEIVIDMADKISVRLTNSPAEIEAAQRLRYTVFYEEYKAIADEKTAASRMDVDEYDAVTDHLVVIDESLPPGPTQIVGTYRLLRREIADKFGKFYTSGEYDIAPLLGSGAQLLELGRSCVLPPYRTRPVLQKLWQGIAHYVAEHKIGLMFGCASLHGTDVDALAPQLSYLYHYHLATPELRPRALDSRYVEMNRIKKEDINVKQVFISLPPLIKGYMRLGASVGDGAVIDHQFNTTDVCIVMPTHLVTEKYFKHYQRVTNNQIVLDDDFAGRIAGAKGTG
jgi:putative hemolysin